MSRIPADPLASEGKDAESAWDQVGLCIERVEGPALPPDGGEPWGQPYNEVVRREDSFGNERWGGGYSIGLTLEAVDGGPYGNETRIHGEVTGSATAFEVQRDVVSAVLEGYSRQNGDARLGADLVFLGRFTYPLFSYEGSFSDMREYTHLVLQVPVRYVMGGIPVNLDIEIWAVLGYTVSGQLLTNGIGARLEPYLATVGTVRASIGPKILRAAATGTVELLQIGVPINVAFTVSPGAEEGIVFGWAATADLDAHWLEGMIDVSIEVDERITDRRLSETLADWEGYSSSTVIAEGSGAVQVSAGTSECGAAERSDWPPRPMSTVDLGDPTSASALEIAESLALLPPGRSNAHPRVQWLVELQSRLLEEPSLGPELAEACRNGRGPSCLPPLTSVLGAVSTEQSLDVLAALAEDSRLDDESRIGALAAAGLALRPSTRLVEAVLHVLDDSQGAVEETAAYAVGNLANNLEERAPLQSELLTRALLGRMSAEDDAVRRTVMVRALANTGNAVALEHLEVIAASEQEPASVRAEAARAVAR
ncbi:MAG: hypothetical protein AAF799_01255 [Myxococcota bacterium]